MGDIGQYRFDVAGQDRYAIAADTVVVETAIARVATREQWELMRAVGDASGGARTALLRRDDATSLAACGPSSGWRGERQAIVA
jgi:hypothetical protein